MTYRELAKCVGMGVTPRMLRYARKHYKWTMDELVDKLGCASESDIEYYIIELYQDR